MTDGASEPMGWTPMPDPADGGVGSGPFSMNLTSEERANLETFDEMDFEVFSRQDWSRLGESHAPYIRVHWPDGHYTDGIDKHIEDMAALFVWAPDLRIEAHPLRVAKDNLTAVTGVMKGTFTQPMPNGTGGTIAPTGKQSVRSRHGYRRDLEPPGHDGRGVPVLGWADLLPEDRPGLTL
jgi:hypothetical protein